MAGGTGNHLLGTVNRPEGVPVDRRHGRREIKVEEVVGEVPRLGSRRESRCFQGRFGDVVLHDEDGLAVRAAAA